MFWYICQAFSLWVYTEKKFLTKTYVVGTQMNHLNETVLMSTQNIC